MNTEIGEKPINLTDASNLAFTARVREATALAKSDIVPQQYRNNPANVMVAMELSGRIGASVMAVMQSLHIIQGKPSFSSSFLIGCVNTCGRFSPMRFRFDGEGEEYGCRAVATDIKSGDECAGPKVTRAMAKSESWSTKPGSKWKTMEELMLTYRAAAFWSRIYAPEISLGMHTVDEMEDMRPVSATVTQVAHLDPHRPTRLQGLSAPRSEAPAHDQATGEVLPAGEVQAAADDDGGTF